MRARATGCALSIGILITGCSALLDTSGFTGRQPDGSVDPDANTTGRDAGSDAGRDAGRDGGLDAGGSPPPPPVLRAPWNGLTTGSVHTAGLPTPRNALRPRFRWQPSETATGYEVQLTASCDPATRASCAFDGALSATTDATEWTPDADVAVSTMAPVGRRYYWRVRACNDDGCSPWSEVRYLDVGRQATDFNGDGYADLVVGAPNHPDGGGRLVGAAYLFLGPDFVESFPLCSGVESYCGISVALLGDLNADGLADLGVLTADPCRLDVRLGATTFGSSISVRIDGPAGSCALSDGGFGRALAGGGDLDGDGRGELLVGESVAGRVHVFRGSSAGVETTPSRTIDTPEPTTAQSFGVSVAIHGDTAGDGLVDLLVGAPHDSGGAISFAGRAWLFETVLADSPPPPARFVAPEPRMYGYLGYSVALADLDDDGLADPAALAPFPIEAAELIVYRGPPARTSVRSTFAIPLDDGQFTTSAGDLNGDGVADVVIGNVSSSQRGRVVWALGQADTGLPATMVDARDGIAATGGFGRSVAVIGDADGDGRADVAVGAPYETVASQSSAGRVYVFRGADDGIAATPADTLSNPSPPTGGFGGTFGFFVGGISSASRSL